MRNLICLKVDKNKAFKNIVIEHQIDEIVVEIGFYVLLARYKGVALTQLHQELLQISDDGTFKIALQIVLILGNTQELGNDRVLDELETVCLKFGSFVLHFQ